MTESQIHKIIFDSIGEGVFTTDHECRITTFNTAAEEISGFSRDEAIGQYCFDIFRTDFCQKNCALRTTLEHQRPVSNERITIMTRDGRKIPVSVSTTILKNDQGSPVGAVEFFRDLSDIEDLKQRLSDSKTLSNIISCNDQMHRIFSMMPGIAESECNVLIQGPSGSGKELVAQAIHNQSPRANGPFIRINCAALPENLLESELFGYARGAFTDAKRDKPGYFYLARGGTLLLDEIGEMPVPLQVKMLRVLNNGEFQPLGSNKTLITDARIISCTNQNLERLIDQKLFREDLYYRVNVITIDIPALRERIEDLPLLVDHFIKRLRVRHRKNIRSISHDAMNLLRRHDFPGNVRELENAIEHAFVLCREDTIEIEHLPHKIIDAVRDQSAPARNKPFGQSSEAAIILEALMRNNGNREATAEELGIHRGSLWRKMKKFEISYP